MKKFHLTFFLFLLIITILRAQDSQVTNMQGYVVEHPTFSIANGNVYLTFATNTRLYKFPVTGPQSPISNPINFDPTFWGPSAVDIAAYGNNVYTITYDFKSTVWVAKIGYSTNGGLDWINYIVDTLTRGNWIPGRSDLPRVIVSEQGIPYFFYYVFENSKDTSGLYVYTFGMPKKVDVNIPRARYEYGIAPFVVTRNNVDHIYVAYFIDSSYYYVHSTNLGQTFSQPREIKSFRVMWPSDNWRPRFQLDNSGKLYFYYYYMSYGQPGQPPQPKMHHLVTYSTDWGLSWSQSTSIDTNFYDIDFRIVGDKFVKSYIDYEVNNLYLQSSSNLINWTDRVKINSVDSSISGDFETELYNNKLAFAWRDRRTGHNEIFYRLMDIPLNVENNLFPEHFTLYQNYPNPFNPKTIISFTLSQRAKTTLRVYDIFGKLVREIINDVLEPGKYDIEFNGSSLSSGVYYYQLSSGQSKETKKMVLIK